ncbi:unnamed protein product [Caenorhabditis auriculariae]|uniref:Major facilitator superfamily (MFS) profile domain-containing protein n=1 Tax=Caenorhabditis auriculariae TaxID=2777116 RepID=A0A8S1H7V5_9PELO|nr:unnamed protein product [Caenorhabditis auriculariae]
MDRFLLRLSLTQKAPRGGSDPSLPAMMPLIPSPFMPIARHLSVDPDRIRDLRSRGYGAVEAEQFISATDEESDEDEEDESVTSTDENIFVRFSKGITSMDQKELATIIMMCLANLCSTVAFSCIAPFYPEEAKLKGLTETEIGIVFGIFEFTMCITALIFGYFMTTLGAKRMFVAGLGVTGTTAIMFGFLNFLPSGRLFFWASVFVRVMEALGDSAFVTSSFAITAKMFPKKIPFVIGILETAAGSGYSIGPTIGGVLYDFGGFMTPFLVLGIVLLVTTIFGAVYVENPSYEEEDTTKGMLKMLKIGRIWLLIFAVVACAVSLSFLDPTLSSHLASFKLGPTKIGFMFFLCGGLYTFTAPLWGLLLDKYSCGTLVMLVGSLSTTVAMILIGPSPLLELEKSLLVIGIALLILGIAAGALYIPSFQLCLDVIRKHGYEANMHTYGCVSGIFQSAFALGSFFGPTLGGFATEKIGFEWTTTYIAGFHVILSITLLIFAIKDGCSS